MTEEKFYETHNPIYVSYYLNDNDDVDKLQEFIKSGLVKLDDIFNFYYYHSGNYIYTRHIVDKNKREILIRIHGGNSSYESAYNLELLPSYTLSSLLKRRSQ